ncbi:MAG TPA: carboxylating nicotinate-nucleotide diphosphorylase [Oligoflexia bacterium]|nr:carboxylating nicotinate-nucleotide diphosphorylase [Oligoflexia bacterium]HMP49684.1 carboxylating nicotinate-nucleotide diphosphorylase [Oligoflexia bacterium]
MSGNSDFANSPEDSDYFKSLNLLVKLAVAEDVGRILSELDDIRSGRTASIPGDHSSNFFAEDVTTVACIDPHLRGDALIISKQDGVIFGHDVAARVFHEIATSEKAGLSSDSDSAICYSPEISDGTHVNVGDVIARIKGSFRTILTGERVALNFLQRLSGVATMTNRAVSLVSSYDVRVLDTRKTTPCYRLLEKAAVRAGGGYNHRKGLFDEFLIKNNHIDALGGNITEAISRCRRYRPSFRLKVEVRDWREVHDAVRSRPDGLLLDNFSPEELSEIIPRLRELEHGSSMVLEASGGINLDNITQYASTGIDEVSLGFLTHSAPALDISLRYKNTERVM